MSYSATSIVTPPLYSIKYTSNGTAPGAGSSLLVQKRAALSLTGSSGYGLISVNHVFIPGSNIPDFKAVITVSSSSATGVIAGTNDPLQFYIEDIGPAVGWSTTAKKTYVGEWYGQWSGTYNYNTGARIASTGTYMYSGYWSSLSSQVTGVWGDNGTSGGLNGVGTMPVALSGATIKKVEVRLNPYYFANNTGGLAMRLYYRTVDPKLNGLPGTLPPASATLSTSAVQTSSGLAEGIHWIDVTSLATTTNWASYLVSTRWAIALRPSSTSSTWKSTVRGVNEGSSYRPLIRVTYEK
jgi:hypothetical protein